MKTLADLKRFLQVGAVVKMVYNNNPDNKHLGKKREVVRIQSNGIYFIDPDGPNANEYRRKKRGSFLDFPKASLLEVTEKDFSIFWPGKRDLTPLEKEIIDNQPRDEKQEEIDMLADGSVMFWRRKRYFEEKGFSYLFAGKNKGKSFDFNTRKVTDDMIKGEKSLEYEFVKKL